jgi:hypothetical protein
VQPGGLGPQLIDHQASSLRVKLNVAIQLFAGNRYFSNETSSYQRDPPGQPEEKRQPGAKRTRSTRTNDRSGLSKLEGIESVKKNKLRIVHLGPDSDYDIEAQPSGSGQGLKCYIDGAPARKWTKAPAGNDGRWNRGGSSTTAVNRNWGLSRPNHTIRCSSTPYSEDLPIAVLLVGQLDLDSQTGSHELVFCWDIRGRY